MPAPLSDDTRTAIRRLRGQGKSIAQIAADLGVSAGVVHKVCVGTPARAGRPTAEPRRGAELDPEAPAAPADPRDELEACVRDEGGDADLGQLTLQIRRAETYLRELRAGAAGPTAIVQSERLIADLTERRRKLRPPPPPPEDDHLAMLRRRRDEVLEKISNLIEAAEQEAAERSRA